MLLFIYYLDIIKTLFLHYLYNNYILFRYYLDIMLIYIYADVAAASR